MKRPVEVPIEAVRESGLLKDAIDLFHPTEPPSDITMLRAAARVWKDYRDRWAAYARKEKEPVIHPVLLVQAQDASGKQISRTDLGQLLSALSEELHHPPARAFAHAFQDGSPIMVDATTVRTGIFRD